MTESETPKQSAIRRILRGEAPDRPQFATDLAVRLEARLEDELADVAATVTSTAHGEHASVSKYDVQAVFQCEGLYLGRLYETFTWSFANVRGKIGHRAIERLILGGYEGVPLELVEGAIERFAADEANPELAKFLTDLDPYDRHDLVAEVSDFVTKFAIDWPRLPKIWLPRIESKLRYPLFGGKVVLQGRVDIALGRPEGSVARVFIADLKSGTERVDHAEDLRFYALVETLVRGTPPFRVGTYYLDSGRLTFEDVTEDTLETAVRRTIEGAKRIRAVQLDPESAKLVPSPLCLYCPRASTCVDGQDWIVTESSTDPGGRGVGS